MERIPEYINILSYLFVVVYMLSVPLETTSGENRQDTRSSESNGPRPTGQLRYHSHCWHHHRKFFDLPAEIRTGFLLLVMSPGGLLALQFARVSKGNRVFAFALLFVFCLLAILITPAVVLWFFHREGAGRLPLAWLILMLMLLIVVPVLIGRGLQRLIPEHTPKLGLWLGRLSIVIFIIAALMAGRYKSPAIKLMGTNGTEAIVLLILCAGGLAVSWEDQKLEIAKCWRSAAACAMSVSAWPSPPTISPGRASPYQSWPSAVS
jgi:hypothetical protein